MAKTNLKDETKERLSYFEDFLKNESSQKQKDKVVNEKTAREYIRELFNSDPSLSNLASAMDEESNGYKSLLEGEHIKGLIEDNKLFERLDKGTRRLKRERISLDKRLSLEKRIPRKESATRRKVINKFMTVQTLKKYNVMKTVNKRGVTRYRNLKGQYVSNDQLLIITDRVIKSSATKRLALEKELKK